MPGTSATGPDRYPNDGEHELGTDAERDGEDDDVESPQGQTERVDLVGRCRRGTTVRSGDEQQSADREAGAESREHRSESNCLPENQSGAR